jgi:hypothetical protein
MESENSPKKPSTEEQPEKAAPQKPPAEARFERERQQFRALILGNPNYFGNLKVSPFKPVLNISANTFYEEIGCVGFQPQFNRLEAVVYVKQPSGYGGGVCSNGTPEYVRFYLSCDNGATWQDLGLTSFTAYDIPEGTQGAMRLEYAVMLEIHPAKKFCFVDNLCLVRAILSWNAPPPPNDPSFTPVWGNAHDTHIQIDPLKFIIIGDLLKEAKVKLPAKYVAALDLSQPLPAAKPKALGAVELARMYKDKGVEPHRFALVEAQKQLSQPSLSETLMAPGAKGILPGLEINPADLFGQLFPVDGSTRYEELECIGLNPDQDILVGIIRVKLPLGYSGGPCTAGSREYVTFWADFNGNGTFETCLGTTSVTVYDIDNIPKDGLEYAVFLPVNLACRRQPCEEGPKVVKIRAILSWQVAPPCANPNYVPVWGNREETLIHIKPGPVCDPKSHAPIIQTAGSMNVDDISPVTGLANGPAALAGFTAVDSPFGGWVILTGHIANTPDISGGATKLKYRVEVSDDGFATWQRVTNTFGLGRDQLLNGIWSDLPDVTMSVDVDDYYEYQEDLIGGPGNAQIFPVGNVLARWQTGGLTGLWQIRITAKDPANPAPTWTSNVVTVRIDNAAPVGGASDPVRPYITITSGGGACADFTIGDVISGDYEVSDEHFGSLTISFLPDLGGGAFTNPAPLPAVPPPVKPVTRTYIGGVPTTGEAGTWSLDTAGMPRCGYVLVLGAYDRTIVDSGAIGRYNQGVVGLCMREPGE